MTVAMWRFDYAKFIITVPIGMSHAHEQELEKEFRVMWPHGDWDRCHKTHAQYSMTNTLETTCIDIWGEAAQLVRGLDFNKWGRWLQRLDIRGEDWDSTEEAVVNLGQHFQRHLTRWNVHVYSTKPASKRMGRDRGGKGFTIGSRKSQFHFTVYARSREKVAIEYRMSGSMLLHTLVSVGSLLGPKAAVVDLWDAVKTAIEWEGVKRLERCFEDTGLGTSYPTFSSVPNPGVPPAQLDFDAMLAEMGTDPDTSYDGLEQEQQQDDPLPF
jgi:hypothetical protein